MIKRTPSLTEQVKTLLKQRILNEEFDEGRIPSETDLANEIGVSRTTIRDALSRLELEGTIFRKQGSGTFVNEASLQIHTRLEEIWAYETILEAHGYTPSTRIINVKEQPSNASIATDIALSTEDSLLVVEKLFLADENPVIFSVNYIPTKFIQLDYTNDDFHPPIYQFLSDFCQQNLSYYLSEIIPMIAPAPIVKILNLSNKKTALLSFDEIGYNQDNQPIVKARSYLRDDLLRLRLIRKEAQ